VARELRALGFDAAALQGGYNAWRETYPVEPKRESRMTLHAPMIQGD
jgi:hypothetical protein